MLRIRLICVGRLKERFFSDAAKEYLKRLSAYCKVEIEELTEARVSGKPSAAELDAALKAEADGILSRLQGNMDVAALCVEGEELDSPGVAELLQKHASGGGENALFCHRRLQRPAPDRQGPRRLEALHVAHDVSPSSGAHYVARAALPQF